MITPSFDITQNEEFLIVSIYIPYAKISEVECHFEDTDFMFYSKPYYLRLNFPGEVQYAENPLIDYNVDKKVLCVKVPKAEKGQVFEGLDLITKLLAPKKNKTIASPMIEVIDGLDATQDEDEDFDWSIEQNPSEATISILGDQCGFASSYSYAVFKLEEETSEIFDVKEPQNKTASIRREERLKSESNQFNEDYYIADLYRADEDIQLLLKYKPEWDEIYDRMQSNPSASSDDIIHFTTKEKEKLLKLPNKEYLLDKRATKQAFLGLIDIIFAYAYNKRTMKGENNVESAWTVNKLSATLSWLESFSSVPEVALASIRRSLCYPLFRHFELSLTVLEDVRKIFLLGRKYVIKCLLDIHDIFCHSEPRYILNDLFITDYCVWMQTERCSSSKLTPLAGALEKILLTKGDIGFNLVDIETFAEVAWMAYNPNAKGFPHSINKDKQAVDAENGEKSLSAAANSDDLCLNMEKLSFEKNQSENLEECSTSAAADPNSPYNDFSEYESCSSCSSGSSCSSNTFETDSDDSYSDDTASSSDSDDDTESTSDSDADAHRHLLKKENAEKFR